MERAVFLAGGGTPEQSFAIDRLFVQRCGTTAPLVYVPTALRSQSADVSLAWFRAAMTGHGSPTVVMCHDLRPRLPADQIGGLYIGGGDTLFLLEEMRRTGFDSYVRNAWKAGVPIYGGSAGAIILGEMLGASKSATDAGQSEMPGLALVPGHLIACHFVEADIERLQSFSAVLTTPIIAIPETAGVVVGEDELVNAGPDLVAVLDGAAVTRVHQGESVKLSRQSSFSRGT